eukprot:4238993-Pyramimonas_sp.AAC.1
MLPHFTGPPMPITARVHLTPQRPFRVVISLSMVTGNHSTNPVPPSRTVQLDSRSVVGAEALGRNRLYRSDVSHHQPAEARLPLGLGALTWCVYPSAGHAHGDALPPRQAGVGGDHARLRHLPGGDAAGGHARVRAPRGALPRAYDRHRDVPQGAAGAAAPLITSL